MVPAQALICFTKFCSACTRPGLDHQLAAILWVFYCELWCTLKNPTQVICGYDFWTGRAAGALKIPTRWKFLLHWQSRDMPSGDLECSWLPVVRTVKYFFAVQYNAHWNGITKTSFGSLKVVDAEICFLDPMYESRKSGSNLSNVKLPLIFWRNSSKSQWLLSAF